MRRMEAHMRPFRSRVFARIEAPSLWREFAGLPAKPWGRSATGLLAAKSWNACADRLPTSMAQVLDACGAPELSDLRLLAAFPVWSESEGTGVLALARNDKGLCAIICDALVQEDPSLRLRLPAQVNRALEAARTFHAATAVVLIQAFGALPATKRDFELMCGRLGAQACGEVSLRRGIGPDSEPQPALALAWTEDPETAACHLWDPSRISYPPM
jgi:hypothetical protein